ncbi:hypothetical protein X943_002261 [Babesia divergens]|uniref:STAG domain-containing protein n=1 Tax=Babesia divergens TaxID=32595 RepID=A0AAD9GHI9_BABDI|nr:hypothetical protein X943_002261 [Babesia divergens]
MLVDKAKEDARQGDLPVSSDSCDDSDDEDYCDVKRPRRHSRPSQELRVRDLAKESHATSRLFEIVVMRKHASLSTCLQRLFLTITSQERHVAIADILSFICECAGFRHSSIASDVVQPYEKAGLTTNIQDVASECGQPNALLSTGDTAAETGENPVNTDTNGSITTVHRSKYRQRLNLIPSGGNEPPSSRPVGQDSTDDSLAVSGNGGPTCDTASSTATDESPIPHETHSVASAPVITYDSFDWWYFRNMFAQLPTEANVSDILNHCKTANSSQHCDADDSIFFPELRELLSNRRSRCLSTKFLLLCMERVKCLNSSLEAQDGWTIGFGKQNNAFLRFKEFFQQFVAQAEPKYMGDVLHVLQWIFALSISGFRAIRQFSLIACNEIVSSLIVKLDVLSKNERVFCKQLQVEIELDQRTHERVHGRDSRVSLNVSKSSLELYKKLILVQRGQIAILRFIKCVYNVNFASKLRDVLVDIRVAAAFALATNVLLRPTIFSGERYLDLVYRILPASDDITRLLLLRYICLVDSNLTDEQFGILLAVHESCMSSGLANCCATIEAIMLKDVHHSYERSVVFNHRNEKAFMRMVESLSKAPNSTLCMLISSVFLPSVPIRNFSIVFQIGTDGLNSKYRNLLIPHPAIAGRESSLVISDSGSTNSETFQQCFMELSRLLKSINATADFVTNLVGSLWEYTNCFTDVGDTVQFLCQGGDVASVGARLDEQQQKLLLHISIASFEHLIANAKDSASAPVEVVESVMSYVPIILRLYKASHVNTKVALHLIEMATSQFSKTDLKINPTIINAISETVICLLRSGNSEDASICAMRLAIRCLYNIYSCGDDTKRHVISLYRMLSSELSTTGEIRVITLHCVLNLLHYFPLELEVVPEMIELIMTNMDTPEGSNKIIWSAIGYVLYEAQIYKCLKKSKHLDETFSKLGCSLLSSLAAQAHNAPGDFHMFVCFCSMVSLLQISSLAGGFDDMPDNVETEMYNILHHFLLLVRPSHLKNHASMPSGSAFLETNKKGISVSDIFIVGYDESHFVLSPLESLLCLVSLFTKVLSARLYCSGASVLLLLQVLSSSATIASAAGVYLRFLANFDDQVLSSLFLFSLIGLYESNSSNLMGELSKKFLGCIMATNGSVVVDKTKLNFDRMVVSAVQYAIQCPSNWAFLTHLMDFIKLYKTHGGTVDTAMLHAQIGSLVGPLEPGVGLREKVWDLLNTIGMQSDDLLKSASNRTKEVDGINRCLNIIRRIAHHVSFPQMISVTLRKRSQKLPSSTCIGKRQRKVSEAVRTISGEISSSESSMEAILDVSPIAVRKSTRSQMQPFLPSVGLMRGNSPFAVTVPHDSCDVTPDFCHLTYQDTLETSSPTSNHSSGMQYSSSVGLISPIRSRLSPF